jgi:hypothetical protein
MTPDHPLQAENTGRQQSHQGLPEIAGMTVAFKGFVLHAVDAVGLVHAMLSRIQALLLPIKTLVLSGH